MSNGRMAYLAAAAVVVGANGALAQGMVPPAAVPQSQNPLCARFEGQLAAIDRGYVDPARADQTKRYEDAVNKQQADLDRTVAQSRRLGCEGGGFFSLFTGQNPQCPSLNQQIQQMRGNLDRSLAELQRLQGGGGDRENQRQAIIAQLAQNNCGPQYRAAANQQRGFFDMLFGGPAPSPGGSPVFGSPDQGTYRTLCVRTCDGYYFPVSFATTPAHFRDDEQACQRMCPAAEVTLYSHRNPGEEVTQAVSIAGRPYTELPNAFKYRQTYNPSCSCRQPGQSWAEALGQVRDTTIEQGDIVVTEQRAKALSLPRDAQGRPIRQDARKVDQKAPLPTAGAVPPEKSATETTDNNTGLDAAKRPVRAVGPTFVPAR